MGSFEGQAQGRSNALASTSIACKNYVVLWSANVLQDPLIHDTWYCARVSNPDSLGVRSVQACDNCNEANPIGGWLSGVQLACNHSLPDATLGFEVVHQQTDL